MSFTVYERRWVARTPRIPLERPAPRAFDRARALRTFDRMTKRAPWAVDWSAAEIPPVVSREEATFWLYAISAVDTAWHELRRARGAPDRHVSVDYDEARAGARAEMERVDFAQPPSRATIARRLAATARQTWGGGSYREIVIALASLLDLPVLLETVLDKANDDAAAAVAADTARRLASMRAAYTGAVTIVSTSGDGVPHAVTERPREEPAAQVLPAPASDTPFAVLREWAEIPGRFGRGPGTSERAWLLHSLAAGFASYVAPYLDAPSFEQARAVVRPAIHRALAQTPFVGEEYHRTESFSPGCYLAASLHLTDEVEAIVAWWSDELPTARTLSFLPAIVYGLRTPEAVVAESRRLEIALASPPAVREWLATTGQAGVEYACEQLAAHAAEQTADAFVDAVAALDVASLPATMLRLTAIPVLYVSARTWIEANFDRSLAALASASDGASALGTTANEILRRFARRGHHDAIAALSAKARST